MKKTIIRILLMIMIFKSLMALVSCSALVRKSGSDGPVVQYDGGEVGNSLTWIYLNPVHRYQFELSTALTLTEINYENVLVDDRNLVTDGDPISSFRVKVLGSIPPAYLQNTEPLQALRNFLNLPASWQNTTINDLPAIAAPTRIEPPNNVTVNEFYFLTSQQNGLNKYGHIEMRVHPGDPEESNLFNQMLATFTGPYFISIPQGLAGYNQIAGNWVKSIAIGADGTIYVATYDGLSISTDGGATFTTKTSTNGLGANHTYEVALDGQDNVYVATAEGLSISTDGGQTYRTLNPGEGEGLWEPWFRRTRAVHLDRNDTLYVGSKGGLSISDDGGNSWTNITDAEGLGSRSVSDIEVNDSGTIYVVAGGLNISTDGGSSWTSADGLPGGLKDITLGANGTLYVATNTGGGLHISTDGGSSWTNKTTADGLADSYL